MNFTQKEINLLNDLKKEEQTCVEKYSKYSQQATTPRLKGLFNSIGQKEQQHLETINQLLSGVIPMVNENQGGQSQQTQFSQANQGIQTSNVGVDTSKCDKQTDSYLCQDALSTEKYVSSSYNTSIFEFRDTNIRNILNHIQKEEQGHGEQIYNYMAHNNMYQ